MMSKRGAAGAPALRRACLLVFCVLAGVVPSSALANSPVNGAAFTTVNEAVDGTGHCKNGNPNVNCNIYDGKEFVWLNGGPSTAYVGDGTYFFAVLAPGGQADPSDGSPKNLSDDFDAYTNRTFTVSGGTVAYAGSHDFAGNKVRLMPYADTPNPGGVYILAICSLADGYPVNASDCKYDAFKIETADVTPGLPLTVTKDANGAYKNTYAWLIQKDVDKTLVKQIGGDVTFHYTVSVTHDAGSVSDVKVTGTITVFNPNVDDQNVAVPVTINGVTDQLSDGTVCPVSNGDAQTLTQVETTFTYSCTLSGLPAGDLDNTVRVGWTEQLLDNGSLLGAGAADFTFEAIGFTETAIDECVNVTDSFNGALGTVCVVGDANPTSFTYARTISVAPGCASYPNTATFTTNDTSTTSPPASQTVTVCGPAPSSALTIGFWKNTNGNSLIQNYCAPVGKPSLATYLSGLGGGSGPFSLAAGKSCKDLVTYVNGIIVGATATDMNKMLKAQMLATALSVYFSGPSLGYTSTSVSKTKPPSTFLTKGALGALNVDLTAICPMVDSLSTGTASCTASTPSTDGFAAGAFPAAALTVQAVLDYEATTPSPFNGSTWYGTNRTKQEIAKNVFDQINNQLAFQAT
jgi:hypothetical protein